jgi:hypothetical protein
MLKFINKQGKKVMEMKDNGDLTKVAEELKATGLVETVEEKDEEQEDK